MNQINYYIKFWAFKLEIISYPLFFSTSRRNTLNSGLSNKLSCSEMYFKWKKTYYPGKSQGIKKHTTQTGITWSRSKFIQFVF